MPRAEGGLAAKASMTHASRSWQSLLLMEAAPVHAAMKATTMLATQVKAAQRFLPTINGSMVHRTAILPKEASPISAEGGQLKKGRIDVFELTCG